MYFQIQRAIPQYLALAGRDSNGKAFVDAELEALQIPRNMYIDRANLSAASQLSGDQLLLSPNKASKEDVDMEGLLSRQTIEKQLKVTGDGKLDKCVVENRDEVRYWNVTYPKIKAVAGVSPVHHWQVVQPAVHPYTFKLVVCTVCIY